jgi:hypothetical protein
LINVLFYNIITTENKEALKASSKNELLKQINISIYVENNFFHVLSEYMIKDA